MSRLVRLLRVVLLHSFAGPSAIRGNGGKWAENNPNLSWPGDGDPD
jgi:hypothetical protein